MINLNFDHDPADAVYFDLETWSDVDLGALGSRVYAECPSTQVMTMVCLIDGVYHCWLNSELGWKRRPNLNPHEIWPNLRGEYTPGSVLTYFTPELPQPVIDAIHAGRTFVAHNAIGFDAIVWNAKMNPVPCHWYDTLPHARSAGLPGGLNDIGRVLLGRGKDDGSNFVKKWMKRPRAKDGNRLPPTPGEFAAILRYNVDDVILLKSLYDTLAITSIEADVIAADLTVNTRGVYVDRGMVDAMTRLAAETVNRATDEVSRLTDGAISKDNIRSVKQVREWVQTHGAWLPNLRKETVERFVADPEAFAESLEGYEGGSTPDIPPVVCDVLRLRQSAIRITGAKLHNVAAAVPDGSDSRLRDMFVYHGAHTGRFSGRKVQLHNLPRPKKGIDVEAIASLHDRGELTFDAVRSAIPDTLTVDDAVSALLRPMFTASPGHQLAIADFASIECRGVAWIADESNLLEVFNRGDDPYCWMASRIYGREIKKGRDDAERQVGKITVLGCGYQLSDTKFGIFCSMQGIDLAKAGTNARECVDAFRSAFPRIAGESNGTYEGRPVRKGGLWGQLNTAAMRSCEGKPSVAGKCQFLRRNDHMIVVLPSGRELTYRNARIEDRVPGYCFTLGLEPIKKPVVVYNSPRGESILYGGKLCWAAGTRIITDRGIVPIEMVRRGDQVWDGVEWVKTDGAVCNGVSGLGTWLGERVTGDHLITDGKTWNAVIRSDVSYVRQCLAWAASSVASPSFKVGAAKDRNQLYHADAGEWWTSILGNSCGRKSRSAKRVGMRVGLNENPISPPSFPTFGFGRNGSTGIPVLSPDVTTRSVTPTRITGVAASLSRTNGETIGLRSSARPLRSKDGMTHRSNSTGSTTTGITNRGTFGWSLDESMPATVAATSGFDTGTTISRSPNSRNDFARIGSSTPFDITSLGVGQPNGLWNDIGQREPVYDLLNCGSRHAYTVVTDAGPVVAHNCENIVQALCRDLLCTAMIRCESEGMPVVLHVHDEIVIDVPTFNAMPAIRRLCEIMSEPPEWASGFPVGVEGYTSFRYFKSAPKGSLEVAALCGNITKTKRH